jgi:hypothetical protein
MIGGTRPFFKGKRVLRSVSPEPRDGYDGIHCQEMLLMPGEIDS